MLLLQLRIALSSLPITCNEKSKEKKNVTKSKESKGLREGCFPQHLNSRRQLRAEKGGEVGPYAEHVLRGGRGLSKCVYRYWGVEEQLEL